MGTDIQKIGQTILAQMGIVANQAAEAAQAAKTYAAQTGDKAPLDSPALIGTPTAPTPNDLDNSTKISTTAYLDRLRGAASGLATLDNTGKIPTSQIPPIQVVAVYTVASQAEMLALSAAVIGSEAIRTDESNALYVLTALPPATLANWVQIGSAPVLSVAGLTGAITAADLTAQLVDFTGDSGTGGVSGDVPAPGIGDGTNKFLKASGVWARPAVADLSDTKTGSGNLVLAASPTLSGSPLAPTASADTNTGQIASTAFVLGQLSQVADGVPVVDGTAARGTSTRAARADHVHPTDTTRAAVNSPTFTGTPAAPTPAVDTSTTQVATTAFVIGQASAVGDGTPAMDGVAARGTSPHYARADHVHPVDTSRAPVASPTFTGTPAAPTAAPGTNTTQVATTAFVLANAAAVPSSSTYPIGMVALLISNDGCTNNSSVSGSRLQSAVILSSGSLSTGGAAQPGTTWKCIAGTALLAGDAGMFVRTA